MNPLPDFNSREFVDGYLIEVNELLVSANAQLLRLDESAKVRVANPRAVQELLRALHTIKGLSAMVGAACNADLAHAMEEALRHVEHVRGIPTADEVDVLLQGTAAMGVNLHRLGESRQVAALGPASPELLQRLSERATAVAPAAAAAALALSPEVLRKLGSAAEFELQTGMEQGRRAYRIEFIPSAERAATGQGITAARQQVEKYADIVKVVPLASGGAAPGALTFLLIVLSDRSLEQLQELLRGAVDGILPLQTVEPARPAPAVAPPIDDEPVINATSIRVDIQRLDDAFDRLSELLVNRNRMAREIAVLRQAGVNVRELQAIAQENARQLRNLRSAIVRTRMVPVASLFEKVPLLVRAVCQSTGKQVRLEIDAGSAELDKAVTDRLFPAIVHLVRNAIDHGIEVPEVRAAQGKPPAGLLSFSCSAYSESQLQLTISDDGAGVDGARLAERAGRPRPADGAALLDLLCAPGLSIREASSATSGRGMGMDIVRRIAVHDLAGALSMTTEAGRGTSFTLRVPLSVTIVDALTFEHNAQAFVVPMSGVEEIVEVHQECLSRPPRGERGTQVMLMLHRGRTMPLMSLGALMGAEDDSPPAKAILISRQGRHVAVGVDRMLGQGEIVIRPMSDPLLKMTGIAGATDLGDGRPTLVLDLAAMVAAHADPVS